MTLIRIGLDLHDTSPSSFESIGRLKGSYGIECMSFNKQLELFLYIRDKYIQKLIQSNSRDQLDIYLHSFGIKKEDFDESEILSDNYCKEKLNSHSINPILANGYFNFSDLTLVSILQSKKKGNNEKNPNIISIPKNNLFSELVTYLHYINVNFIIQIFSSYKKKKISLGGQFVIFSPTTEYRFMQKSIKENIESIANKFEINIKFGSRFKIYNRLNIKQILHHRPYKLYFLSPIIVNEILKIPNLNKIYKLEDNKLVIHIKKPDINLNEGIPIGIKIIPGLKNPPFAKVSFEELTSHFCCFGMTSQGKSRLMYNFLSFIEKTGKKFLVIDPKGEYFDALANTVEPVFYFKIGSLEFPLTINIFSVPLGLTIDSHIQFVYSLLLNIMGDDVTPQMNRLLFKGIEYTVNNNGSMLEFIFLLEHPERLNIKGSYLEMSGNAVLNRILPLIIGPAKNCFLVKTSSIDFSELAVKNVIIDLGNFELIENTVSRKIFVNTFLHNFIHSIKYKNSSIRDIGSITNFIIIEEIQKIAPLHYQGKNEINSFIGLAPWTVRAYGISMGFVGTDPNVETPILTNTGLSIIFYTKSHVENLLKLLGIPYQEYRSYLNELQERRKFLLCYKGKITLMQSFDFQIPNGSEIKNRYEFLINLQQGEIAK